MYVAFNVMDPDHRLAERWCSVARTLHACRDGLKRLTDEELTDLEIDKYERTLDEVTEILPMLDRLHKSVQNFIFKSKSEVRGPWSVQPPDETFDKFALWNGRRFLEVSTREQAESLCAMLNATEADPY